MTVPSKRARWSMRCPDAWELVDDWLETDAYRNADRGIPADCYRCPPCHRRHLEPWLVWAAGAVMVLDAGSMFGLKVRRHRAFVVRPPFFSLLHPCTHHRLLPFMHKAERAYADAMGCTWMNKTEAREAIPPAYCEWIGEQLLSAIRSAA